MGQCGSTDVAPDGNRDLPMDGTRDLPVEPSAEPEPVPEQRTPSPKSPPKKDKQEMGQDLRAAARRAGWEEPADKVTQKKLPKRRRGPGAGSPEGEQRMPEGFEFPDSDDDAELERPDASPEEVAGENDSVQDEGEEFLAEVTQYAAIDTKVDADLAAEAGVSVQEFERRRVGAEHDIMECHAKEEYKQRQEQEAAKAAFEDETEWH